LYSPACPNNPRRLPRPPARLLIQRIGRPALGAAILLPILGREVHLALPLPVLRVNLARDNGGVALGRARGPRRQRLVAQEPVPGAPWIAERAGLEERVEQVVRVEAPERVVLAPDVEVGACLSGYYVSVCYAIWNQKREDGLLESRKFILK
jgi:hypothetical protein